MKILIREANWLGDAVMSIPTLQAIHDQYPDADMAVVARETLLPLFNLLPWGIETIPLGSMRSWLRLREKNFDVAVIFPNSFRSALEVFLSGAKKRIGYATSGRGLFLTERILRNKDSLHQADYYYYLLHPLGIKGTRPDPKLRVTEKDKEEILRWLKEKGVNPERPLITISAGASYGEAKCWPEENFAELIQRLSGNGEIVFIGTEKDTGIIDKIISIGKVNPVGNVSDVKGHSQISNGVKAFNLPGETSILQLASLFSISRIVISNDNGAMHLADLLGVNVICIFGPTDCLRTGPLGEGAVVLQDKVDCAPCKKRRCTSKKCFDKITVDRVYEAARNLL